MSHGPHSFKPSNNFEMTKAGCPAITQLKAAFIFAPVVVQAWMMYGIITWKDSLIGEPRSDPRVSFGFKEMYCDALMYPGSEQNSSQPCSLRRATSKTAAAVDGEKELPAPPRLTVYQTLTDVLNRYDKVSAVVCILVCCSVTQLTCCPLRTCLFKAAKVHASCTTAYIVSRHFAATSLCM